VLEILYTDFASVATRRQRVMFCRFVWLPVAAGSAAFGPDPARQCNTIAAEVAMNPGRETQGKPPGETACVTVETGKLDAKL
jgi:hypothetical protein